MTITLTLPPETERRLTDRAARCGRDVPSLVREWIEREVVGPPTLAEILAPFRAEVAASGVTDGDLDALFEEARDEVWRERSK